MLALLAAMRELGYRLASAEWSDENKRYEVDFQWGADGIEWASGDTLPEAVAKAAALALGIEVEG